MLAIIHAADIQDRDGGVLLMGSLFGLFPFLCWVASALVVEIRSLFWLGLGAKAGVAGRSVRPQPKPRV